MENTFNNNDESIDITDASKETTLENQEVKDGTLTEDETKSLESERAKDTIEQKKKKFSEKAKAYFSPLRMTYLALFTALAYVMYLPVFEFSIIPAVPFLKIDFSNAFALIAGFALGPIAGVVVGVLKELLHALTFSQTIGIGEIANILMILPYVLIPSIIYKKHKGIKSVLLSLILACVAVTVWSFPVNYTISFPFFLKVFADLPWNVGMSQYLSKYWYWAVLFNLVKTVLISTAVFILYKPLSRLIKLTNKKFSKKK